MTHYFNCYDDAFNAAAENNEADDEGCRYEVARFGNRYRIAVYEEGGEFLGYL